MKRKTLEMKLKKLGWRFYRRNTYARYEQGKSVPTIEKFNELIHALCPNTHLVFEESAIHGSPIPLRVYNISEVHCK